MNSDQSQVALGRDSRTRTAEEIEQLVGKSARGLNTEEAVKLKELRLASNPDDHPTSTELFWLYAEEGAATPDNPQPIQMDEGYKAFMERHLEGCKYCRAFLRDFVDASPPEKIGNRAKEFLKQHPA